MDLRPAGRRRAAKPPWLLALNVALATMLGLACAPKRPPSAQVAHGSAKAERRRLDDERRALQVKTFDHAWRRIADTYPYRDFRGLDWAAVRDELRPRAERCRSAAELRPVLQEMLARLGESHFQVLPGDGRPEGPAPDAAGSPAAATARVESPSHGGDAGMDVRLIGAEFVVSRVDEGGPADSAGIAPGWRLIAAGDQHVADVLRRTAAMESRSLAQHAGWAVLNGALRGEPGTPVTVEVAPPGGTPRRVRLVRQEARGVPTRLGNLPDLVASLDARTLDGNVGYVRFNLFLAPVAEPFSEAVRGFVKDGARGVVIDLRGNPGGIGGLVMGMAGHFVHEQGRSLGAMKTRAADLDFIANPRGPGAIFDGPVAILVDGLSLSTSEMFAAGMQQIGRARIFGERTGGMALPSIIEGLPNGDRLQFAVADLTAPGGRRIEGVGVTPDEIVPLRKEDLAAGRDAALDAALQWILSDGAQAPEPERT